MTQRVANFDRVARLYRWAEYLNLGRSSNARASITSRPSHTAAELVLGDGDGRFLAQLLRINPHLEAIAIDTSASMLQLLCRRCAFAAGRLQTQQASALTVDVPSCTDLIVTHFLLDCLTQSEVDALTQHLATQLAPGTLWLVSDFAIPPVPVLRSIARFYIRTLYLAFRILTGLRTTHLPDPQTALTRAGFTCIARRERLFGLLYTELWQRL